MPQRPGGPCSKERLSVCEWGWRVDEYCFGVATLLLVHRIELIPSLALKFPWKN